MSHDPAMWCGDYSFGIFDLYSEELFIPFRVPIYFARNKFIVSWLTGFYVRMSRQCHLILSIGIISNLLEMTFKYFSTEFFL